METPLIMEVLSGVHCRVITDRGELSKECRGRSAIAEKSDKGGLLW